MVTENFGWILKFTGVVYKDLSLGMLFGGGDRNRTDELRFCRPPGVRSFAVRVAGRHLLPAGVKNKKGIAPF
jgi:hypothetical protein